MYLQYTAFADLVNQLNAENGIYDIYSSKTDGHIIHYIMLFLYSIGANNMWLCKSVYLSCHLQTKLKNETQYSKMKVKEKFNRTKWFPFWVYSQWLEIINSQYSTAGTFLFYDTFIIVPRSELSEDLHLPGWEDTFSIKVVIESRAVILQRLKTIWDRFLSTIIL